MTNIKAKISQPIILKYRTVIRVNGLTADYGNFGKSTMPKILSISKHIVTLATIISSYLIVVDLKI
jgi:hypothetical protein